MMMHGNYLPNLANYAYKYLKGDRTMSKTGPKPRKERGFCIRKYEHTQQMQSPKNKAKTRKGGMLASTLYMHWLQCIPCNIQATEFIGMGCLQQA
jgi:hypothetical protein